MTKTINDVRTFFDELGGLHDARLLRIDWLCVQRQVQLAVHDLCSDFEELPEYPSRVEGHLVMHDVLEVGLKSDPGGDQPRVYDVTVARSADDSIVIVFHIAPSGRLEVTCGSVTVSADKLTDLPKAAIEQLA